MYLFIIIITPFTHFLSCRLQILYFRVVLCVGFVSEAGGDEEQCGISSEELWAGSAEVWVTLASAEAEWYAAGWRPKRWWAGCAADQGEETGVWRTRDNTRSSCVCLSRVLIMCARNTFGIFWSVKVSTAYNSIFGVIYLTVCMFLDSWKVTSYCLKIFPFNWNCNVVRLSLHSRDLSYFEMDCPEFTTAAELREDLEKFESMWGVFEEFNAGLQELRKEDWISFRHVYSFYYLCSIYQPSCYLDSHAWYQERLLAKVAALHHKKSHLQVCLSPHSCISVPCSLSVKGTETVKVTQLRRTVAYSP